MSDGTEIARRGRELFERGQLHLSQTVRTGWATREVSAEARREVEIEARAALIVVLAAARGLDQLFLGGEGVASPPGYQVDRPEHLTAIVYAADKSLHLRLGIGDIEEAAPAPGPYAYGQSAYGGRSSFEPVLRWPSSVRDRTRRDAAKRRVYEELLQGERVRPALAEVATWFAQWWLHESLSNDPR